jgi:antitoxin VapB
MANANSAAQSAAPVKTAKLFKNGRSQAVRLPKEFRFEGTEGNVRRNPATGEVLLSKETLPSTPAAEPKKTLRELYAILAQGGAPEGFLADRKALVAQSSWQELFAAWDELGPSDDEELERGTAPPVERDFF